MLAQETRHLFNVSEYLLLFEKQIISNSKRTELINGEIIELRPLGHRHAKTQVLLFDFLRTVYANNEVYMTGSVLVNNVCMPEPDVYVLKENEIISDNYPKAQQIAFVVEVGDSTIKTDMLNNGEGRLSIYAASNIAIAWVVDVEKKTICEFSKPEGNFYKSCLLHRGLSELLGKKVPVESLVSD